MRFRLPYIIFFIFIFYSCKKYPEGGLRILAKRKIHRQEASILNPHQQIWGLQKYEVNGIDSTNFVIINDDKNIKKRFLHFFVASHQNYISTLYSGVIYTCELKNDNQNLQVNSSYQSSFYTVSYDTTIKIRNIFTPIGVSCNWKIIKLKKKEMIFETNTGSTKYRIELKRD